MRVQDSRLDPGPIPARDVACSRLENALVQAVAAIVARQGAADVEPLQAVAGVVAVGAGALAVGGKVDVRRAGPTVPGAGLVIAAAAIAPAVLMVSGDKFGPLPMGGVQRIPMVTAPKGIACMVATSKG